MHGHVHLEKFTRCKNFTHTTCHTEIGAMSGEIEISRHLLFTLIWAELKQGATPTMDMNGYIPVLLDGGRGELEKEKGSHFLHTQNLDCCTPAA